MTILALQATRHRCQQIVRSTIGMLMAALVLPPAVAADTEVPTNWAVVATRPEDQHVADLLAARLAAADGMLLVERSAIAALLEELDLKALGLVDPKNAIKFGRLATADAIAVVERTTPDELLRVRLLETRTGVRLADEFALPADVMTQCVELSRRLLPLRAKLPLLANGRRHLIGIIGIRSEEPGDGLDLDARTLSVLLEHDLHKLPEVVVLDREQLSRLRSEADLTGLDIDLRGSTLLLEGGMRRQAENGEWAFSLRLLPLTAGNPQDVSVHTQSNIAVARSAIVNALAQAIQATSSAIPATTPPGLEGEASLLGTRAQWLISHDRYLDAAPLAEAAFALDPDLQWYRKSMAIHNRLASDSRRDNLDRLTAALQGNQIDQQYLNQALRASPGAADYPTGYMFMCSFKPPDPTPHEVQILTRTRRLQQEKFEFLLAERRRHDMSAVGLIVGRLKKSLYFADSAEQFVADTWRMIEYLDHETATGHFPRHFSDSRFFPAFFQGMRSNLETAITVLEPGVPYSSYHLAVGHWGPEKIADLLQRLAQHEDPRTRMLGFYGMTWQTGEPGADAARRVLDLWMNELTPGDARSATEDVDSVIERAGIRLHQEGEFVPWLENVLARAEANQDANHIIRWASALQRCLFNVDSAHSVAWARRVSVLLTAENYDPSLADAARRLRTSLSRSVSARLRRGEHASKSSAAWQKYSVRELAIGGLTREMQRLEYAIVDRTPNQQKPIVMAWRGPPRIENVGIASGDVIVARLSLSGGQLQEIGRFESDDFSTTSLAVSSAGDVAVGSRASGVAIVSARGVQRFTADHGLPNSRIHGLAWLHDRLYLALPGAVGELTVASGEFRLLASSKAVRPSAPLDGGAMYELKSLHADPDRDCVWLSVDDQQYETSRSGIWRIGRDGEVDRVYHGRSGPLSWTDRGFFFMLHHPGNTALCWNIFDVETGEMQSLDRLQTFHPTNIRQAPGWAHIAGDIVSNLGYLSTPVGRYQHETARWDQPLGRCGIGLVCVSFQSPRLWYIEPRATHPGAGRDDETASPDPPEVDQTDGSEYQRAEPPFRIMLAILAVATVIAVILRCRPCAPRST